MLPIQYLVCKMILSALKNLNKICNTSNVQKIATKFIKHLPALIMYVAETKINKKKFVMKILKPSNLSSIILTNELKLPVL